ncbi:MAG: MGMT family protein [Pseudanabaenaceae cyanobacterium bins.39]|nr:MGMT family protein [Pseudanabaenaceae cyanobacterium bins.39]
MNAISTEDSQQPTQQLSANPQSHNTYERIYDMVRLIPWGKVATYGQIGELCHLARKARLVGYALYRVDMSNTDIPWQRVVNARGEISLSPLRYGTDYLQRSLLEREGIIFSDKGKIDLRKYLWRPDLKLLTDD